MSKIAIIEDDNEIAGLYKTKLEHSGYEVVTAANGAEGLIVLEKTLPDLILLDLNMPEMRGEEMLIKLRETEWGKHLKVIILTNLDNNVVPDNIEQLGVLDFFVKSNTDLDDILRVIKFSLDS